MMNNLINTTHYGDVLTVLPQLIEQGVKVNMCVTSPPYWGLRDYGCEGQLGLESTPQEYIAKMVEVFRLVRELLTDDAVCFINIGDSYAGSGINDGTVNPGISKSATRGEPKRRPGDMRNLKPKDLVGIPWMLAFALRDDGWWLRSDIIWHKPSCMPESVTDRPTRCHEYVFLLAKSQKYFYDAEAIKENGTYPAGTQAAKGSATRHDEKGVNARPAEYAEYSGFRNARTVWTINPKPYSGAHFATYPPKLVERCVLAGTSEKGHCPKCGKGWVRVVERQATKYNDKEGQQQRKRCAGVISGGSAKVTLGCTDFVTKETLGWQPSCSCDLPPEPGIVLDCFMGSGTTGMVAEKLGRRWIGIELNENYKEQIDQRTAQMGLGI